jgi:hypothetical protein
MIMNSPKHAFHSLKYLRKRIAPLAAIVFILAFFLTVECRAEAITLQGSNRPEWVSRDGIVMAGNWEPLFFRIRRDGTDYAEPSKEQQAAYESEASPEVIAMLKKLGVNFIMMHCYKGAGWELEKESMTEAVRRAKLYHDAGFRVGAYACSGAFLWEPFFKERPQAEKWLLLDRNGKPIPYSARNATYRYYWNRNQPEAVAFYQEIVRFAVERMKTDLVHLDNYSYGPEYDDYSVELFRKYLDRTFSPEQLAQMGITDTATASHPDETSPAMLRYAWKDFSSEAMADSYQTMSRYARSLRREVMMECNPGGLNPGLIQSWPIDHARLMTGGEAIWSENRDIGYKNGKFKNHIRTYKFGRLMNNMTFAYVANPLDMAESMAFNLDCLGCVCWFEYGKIQDYPGSKGRLLNPDVLLYIRFFRERRDLLRGAEVRADVAVLRSYPSQLFGGKRYAELISQAEEELIRQRIPFQIIYDGHLQVDTLKKYPVVLLAGCAAMSDKQVEEIRRYVQNGGKVCCFGEPATHDEWMQPRTRPSLQDLPADGKSHAAGDAVSPQELFAMLGDRISARISGPDGLCAEFTEQKNRRLIHLVNYQPQPTDPVSIHVRIPAGKEVESVSLVSPAHEKDLKLDYMLKYQELTVETPPVNIYSIVVMTWK